MEHSGTFLTDLRRSEAGNILPLAGAGVLVMTAMVGSAVDISRSYQVQNRLQNACDSAVLAARRTLTNGTFDANARATAMKFFKANFNETKQGTKSTALTLTSEAGANNIRATATTVLPMVMMQMFNAGDTTINVKCSSTMGVGNSDVMMVLDVTGSMGQVLEYDKDGKAVTRIAALKKAANNFYDTLANSTAGTNARIRYGIVPYSSTVNVKDLGLPSNYFKDSMTIQSIEPVWKYKTTTTTTYSNPVTTTSSDTTESSGGWREIDYAATMALCNAKIPTTTQTWSALSAPTTIGPNYTYPPGKRVSTTTTARTQTKTAYKCEYNSYYGDYSLYKGTTTRSINSYVIITEDAVVETNVTKDSFKEWIYKPVTYDTSLFKTFATVTTPTGEYGADEMSTWTGCIEERATVAKPASDFSTLTGGFAIPSDPNLFDLDIDSAPTSDEKTKWGPLWWQVAYERSTVAPFTSPGGKYTYQAWNGYTYVTADWKSDQYCPYNSQKLQVMEKGVFEKHIANLAPVGGTYLDIGMLWGTRLISPQGIFASDVNAKPDNGGNVQRHIIFMTDGEQAGGDFIYQAYGIEKLDRRISGDGVQATANARHSARFRAICSAAKAKGIRVWVIGFNGDTTLGDDLKACHSPNSDFVATNAAKLNEAFQEIAKQVGELRVMQ